MGLQRAVKTVAASAELAMRTRALAQLEHDLDEKRRRAGALQAKAQDKQARTGRRWLSRDLETQITAALRDVRETQASVRREEATVARLQRRAAGDERAALRAKNRIRERADTAVSIPPHWDDTAEIQTLRGTARAATARLDGLRRQQRELQGHPAKMVDLMRVIQQLPEAEDAAATALAALDARERSLKAEFVAAHTPVYQDVVSRLAAHLKRALAVHDDLAALTSKLGGISNLPAHDIVFMADDGLDRWLHAARRDGCDV